MKPTAAHIELRIAGTLGDSPAAPAGWTTETYAIGGLARGTAKAATPEALAPDAMKERFEGREAQAAAGIKPCFLSILNQRGALRVTDMASKSTAESR